MSDENQPGTDPDDFDNAARINFRDYPSSALVAIAALTSGLAWLLYKRRGRKSSAQSAVAQNAAESNASAPRVEPPGGKDP